MIYGIRKNAQQPCRRLILVLIVLALSHAMLLPPLFAMDLKTAYTKAKEHDPLFGAAFFEHEASRTLPRQARSFLLPQVQANGSMSRYYYDTAPAYYIDYDARSLSLTFRQPLIDFQKFYQYRQYNIRGSIGDAKFASAEQNLILRVSEAYFSGLTAKDVLAVVDSEKKAVIEQRDQARKMYQAGVATLTDVHESEARCDSVLADEVEARNNLEVKMQALKRVIGEDPGELQVLRQGIPLGVPEPASVEGWIDILKKNNPILKSYAYQIHVQEQELKKTIGQHFPTVDLVTGYSDSNTNNYVKTDETSYLSVGVQLTIPIFSGGYTSAKVAETRALLKQVQKEYENALSDTTQKLCEAFLGIRGSSAKIDSLLTAEKSASASLHSNKMGLNAGIRTTVDVLNAQRELRNVGTKLLQARYDFLMNTLKLKFYAGTLTVDDVDMINHWLM